MSDAPERGSRLLIRSLRHEYRVARDHPAPERLRWRLDEALSGDLSSTLAAALAPWVRDDDPGIWLIRRLVLSVDVNAGWESDQIARQWAAQLSRALDRALAEGGENVVYFPNRPAYLAAFLLDLAEGFAWSRWYHGDFEGLRPLPVSAALRTAVLAEPETGAAALLHLQPEQLRRVLRELTRHDARRVLEGVAPGSSPPREPALRAAWSAWRTLFPLLPGEVWGDALHVYLRARAEAGPIPAEELRAAAAAVAHLARILLLGPPPTAEEAAAALARGDLAGLYAAVGAGDAEALQPLLAAPGEWLEEITRDLVSRRSGRASPEAPAAEEPLHTAFGGVFVLLPLLDDLPLEEACRDWPDPEGCPAAALIRLLLLCKCFGSPRAQAAFQDPVLRAVTAVPGSITLGDLGEWQSGVKPRHRAALGERLVEHHRRRGAVGARTLVLAGAGPAGRRRLLLIDCARGLWLALERRRRGGPGPSVEPFAPRLEGEGPLTVLAEEALAEALTRRFPSIQAAALPEDLAALPPGADPAARGVLERLGSLGGDLAHLDLPSAFGLSAGLDAALSLAAQGLMRSLAWRLPGFAWSSLPYLQSQFLELPASLEVEAGRRTVRLGRPPLDLVLTLSGMNRGAFTVGWLGEPPFILFPEG